MKIEKGIPVPNNRNQWTNIAEIMQHGDSVLVDGQNARTALGFCLSRRGFKVITRKDKDTGKIRVWAIK